MALLIGLLAGMLSAPPKDRRSAALGLLILGGIAGAVMFFIAFVPDISEWLDMPMAQWSIWHLAGAIIFLYVIWYAVCVSIGVISTLLKKSSN